MSRIELQIVALGNFANVQSEIAKLNSQVIALNKNFSGIGINPTDISRIKQYTKEFDSALRSTGAFTAKQVQLQSETEKFGKSLEAGHLKLRQYFQIINQGAKQSQGSLRNLALEQTKLQNSIIVKDPLKGGLATVYTPNIINEAANAAKIATNQQKLYNMAIDRGATSLINWGKNTQWAGRQLTVGLTVPLTMFGNASSKVFQQMDQELTRMQKVYGTGLVQPSQAALATIRKDVSSLASELAKSWGTPIKDTAAMAADLAATGKTGLDLVNATREALRLATLGELDKQQAMQATVSLQNVYKLSTSELSDAVNFLNAVENQTSTSLQDLVDAIPRVGPVVAQMGGTFKDTAAMMVAMKEAGVPAAQSANAIKAALASIINPTKAAREAFKSYGIDVRSIATNNKGNAVGMLTDLQQKMKDLSPLVKEQLIEKMFGKFQMSRITALLDNLNKAGSQSRTVFQLMQASSQQLGAMAEQELKIQTESTTGKYKRAVESLKADLLPIGEQFTKVITKIINFGDSVVKMLDKLGPMKNLLGLVLGFVAVAGPLIMLTGVFGNLFGYIMKGIGLFRTMRTEGAGLKGITGLLTAENIAASQATQLMSQRMLEDVDATKLLASAIDQLNLKLESMVALMSRASQAGGGVAVAQAEAMAVASTTKIKRSGRLPLKFATGGSVPGTGNYDTQPAMLTPGEFVVNKKAAQEHKALLHQINGGAGALGGIVTHGITHYGKWSSSKRFTGVGDIISKENDPNNETAKIINQAAASLGIEGKVLNAMLQTDLAHRESIKLPNGKKDWTNISNLYQSTGAENNALNFLTNPRNVNNTKIFRTSIDKAVETVANNIGKTFEEYAPEEVKAAGQRIMSGNHPVTRLETIIFNEALKDLETRVQNGSLKVGPGGIPPRTMNFARVAQAVTEGRVKGTLPVTESLQVQETHMEAAKAGQTLVRETQKGLKQGVDTEIKSASPSKEGMRIGKNLGSGLVIGASDKSIITQAQTGGRKVGSALLLNIESQMSRNPQFMIAGGAFEPIPTGKNPETDAKKRMGLKGRMGGGMGLMAGSMAMSMLGDKIPGGSVVSGTLTGASLGMMFGPEGAAVGAIAGLAISGISALMKKEKEHAELAKSSFTSDTNLIGLFGDKAFDTSLKIQGITGAVEGLTNKMGGLNPEIQKFVEYLQALPKESGIGKMIEFISNSDIKFSALTGNIRSQVATAIAGGLDPKEADKFTMSLLAAAGRAQDFGAVWANISSSVSTQAKATTTMFNKMAEAANAAAVVPLEEKYGRGLRSYENLAQEQKIVADKMLTTFNIVGNGTLSFDQLNQTILGLNESSIKGQEGINYLTIAIKNSGDKDTLTRFNSIVEYIKQAGQEGKIAASQIMLMNLAMQMGFDPNAGGQANIRESRISPFQKLEQYINSSNFKQFYEKYQSIINPKPKITGGGVGGDTTLSTLDKLIAELEASKQALQDQKDALDKSIQKQKDYNDQLQKTQDYLTSTTDLENQIRMARAKGDYLQVGLLKQQLAAKQTAFNAGVTISPAEQRSQDLADRIAELTKQIQEANAQNKVIKKEIKAANKASGGYIPSYARGSFGGVFGPGTSTSDSIPAYLSNGEYVLSANAVRNIPGNIRTLDKINGGDISSFNSSAVNNYSISVNVAGTNANPDQIAQAVLNTIQRRSNMNHTTRIA